MHLQIVEDCKIMQDEIERTIIKTQIYNGRLLVLIIYCKEMFYYILYYKILCTYVCIAMCMPVWRSIYIV